MAEHLWERLEGETEKSWLSFEMFRQLGPERTVDGAFHRYWMRPGNRRNNSGRAKDKTPAYFSHWAVQYNWWRRAAAWDEEVAALARDQELDRELQARLAEQEEDRHQRQLMKEEARAARAVGRRILLRLLQGVEAGQLDRMSVPDLLPHLQKVATLLEAGQKLERLERGEATDRTETQVSQDGLAQRIAALLIEAAQAKQLDLQALAALREELEAMER